MTTPLQDAAVEYVSAGLRILALTGKKPNARVHGESWSWEDSFWADEPLTAESMTAIEHAFSAERDTTGIAILIPEDFLVADVDTDAAAQLLLDLGFEAHPESVVAKTKNGLHIWFWCPGANRNRWLGGRTLLFKGLGGYVVAPPSVHLDEHGVIDGHYEWVTPLVQDGVRYMPDPIPAAAMERFTLDDQFAELKPDKGSMTTFTLTPAEGVPWWQWEKVWNYGLEGLERAIETAEDGNQNNIIHWAALTAREEGVPYEVAKELLLAAAIRGNHPANRARDTIRGAYKAKRG